MLIPPRPRDVPERRRPGKREGTRELVIALALHRGIAPWHSAGRTAGPFGTPRGGARAARGRDAAADGHPDGPAWRARHVLPAPCRVGARGQAPRRSREGGRVGCACDACSRGCNRRRLPPSAELRRALVGYTCATSFATFGITSATRCGSTSAHPHVLAPGLAGVLGAPSRRPQPAAAGEARDRRVRGQPVHRRAWPPSWAVAATRTLCGFPSRALG